MVTPRKPSKATYQDTLLFETSHQQHATHVGQDFIFRWRKVRSLLPTPSRELLKRPWRYDLFFLGIFLSDDLIRWSPDKMHPPALIGGTRRISTTMAQDTGRSRLRPQRQRHWSGGGGKSTHLWSGIISELPSDDQPSVLGVESSQSCTRPGGRYNRPGLLVGTATSGPLVLASNVRTAVVTRS